ncbi:MAG: cytochrome P450 [Novosphingobium sp.]
MSPPAAFTVSLDELLSDAPHPLWARLRETCPVVRIAGAAGERPVFYVTTFAEADAVMRDGETFSSTINAESIERFMGPTMLAMDGDRHRTLRGLVSRAFRPSQLARWEGELIRPAIDRLLDEIVPRGRAELVAEVTSRFPVRVICGIAGVPLDDKGDFLRWTVAINRGMLDPAAGVAASAAIRAYLEPIVAARRADPADDLISDIVHAEIAGRRLGDEEVFGFLRLLLTAGTESTHLELGNILHALLSDPGLFARVRADRSLVPAAVEEAIRWDVSNTMVSRAATCDTELAGCPIPAGAAVRVLTASANRDERRFAAAGRYDPDRPPSRHLGFGTGQHQCLGMHVARLELKVALNAVLDRLENLRLDPDFPPPAIRGFSFRGPEALHVRFG